MSKPASRVHLSYLDGLRGIAALFVVLHHMWQYMFVFFVARPLLRPLPRWFSLMAVLQFGSIPVAVFIVLSGYCLMLPVARADGLALPGGIARFVRRRARRILPPYYAALILSMVLLLVVRARGRTLDGVWDVLTVGSVLSHIVMVHNLTTPWHWTINPPLWSIALEFQIYLVFALVLLPLLRRAGLVLAIAVAFGVGWLVVEVSGVYTSGWLIGLFAFGAAAATFNFAPRAAGPRLLDRVPWLLLATVLWLSLIWIMRTPQWTYDHVAAFDILSGLATSTTLVGMTRRLQHGRVLPWPVRWLATPPMVKLGHFSFSLYLIHYPLVALIYFWLGPSSLSADMVVLLLVGAGLPSIVLLAYGFHCLFERPFMRPVGKQAADSRTALPPLPPLQEGELIA